MNQAEPFQGEIYVHTNVVNEKSYVGQTTAGMEKRWKLHQRCARSPRTPAYKNLFSKAIRKYGADAFEHTLLSVAGSQEQLDNLEKVWIILLQAKAPHGYNLTDGGDSGTAGHIVSPEVRARLSAAAKEQWQRQNADPAFKLQYREHRKGWKPSASHLAALLAAHQGKKQSPETIAKRVAKLTGLTRSPEARIKMRLARLGHHHSAETKARMSAAQKARPYESQLRGARKRVGQKRTPEQIQHLRASFTPERRAKLAASLKGNTRTLGYKHTPEAIVKIAEASRRRKCTEK